MNSSGNNSSNSEQNDSSSSNGRASTDDRMDSMIRMFNKIREAQMLAQQRAEATEHDDDDDCPEEKSILQTIENNVQEEESIPKNSIIHSTPLMNNSGLRNYKPMPDIAEDAPLDRRFVTPISARSEVSRHASKVQPKVLCTVDMRAQLNTPISKSLMSTLSSQKKSSSTKVRLKEKSEKAKQPLTFNNENNAAPVQITSLKNKLIKDVFNVIVVKNSEYICLKRLGKGGSSQVYHCYNPATKEECAVKVIKLSKNSDEASMFINEVEVLKQLQGCDRIIKLHQHELTSDKKLYLVLEKGGRDFAHILKEHCQRSDHLPSFMIIYYWMQMLYAVQQMHSHRVIHCDLKPANFIEIRERLKLIDFGISSCVQIDFTSVVKTTAIGTFNYISPEALCNDPNAMTNSPKPLDCSKYKVGFKADVWSLGCILYEMIYKRTPFAHIMQPHVKHATITNPNHVINFPEASWAPARIIECAKACLIYDVKKRPTIDELIVQYQDFLNKF